MKRILRTILFAFITVVADSGVLPADESRASSTSCPVLTQDKTRTIEHLVQSVDEKKAAGKDRQETVEKTLVYECPDGLAFQVRIGPGEVGLFLPDRFAVLPQVPAASGSKYVEDDLTFWSKGDKTMLEVGDVRHTSCRLNRRKAPWEDARLRHVAFRGVGNEPGWHLEIRSDRHMTFVTDYGKTVIGMSVPTPEVDQSTGTRTYHAISEGHDLLVRIQAQVCHDTMSGETFESLVNVILDEREYFGCGRELGAVFAGTWKLESFGEGEAAGEPIPGSEPTLRLDAWGVAAGNTGCNAFTGGYEYDVRPSLSFRPFATTKRACTGDLMLQEVRFFEAIRNTRAYRLSEAILRLVDGNGVVLLVFDIHD